MEMAKAGEHFASDSEQSPEFATSQTGTAEEGEVAIHL